MNHSHSSMEDPVVSPKKFDKKAIALSRIKRRVLRHLWLVRLGIVALVVLIFYLLFRTGLGLLARWGIPNYTGLVADFILTPSEKIQTSQERTNILILGKGGDGHEAPDLTDTIIFASVSHQKPSVTLISLPRDIWIPELRAKLNSAYYWGNEKGGGGLVLAKATVEEIIGQPVHYGLVVDFSGFVKVIDILGGIEVEVERSFVDEKYPIAGKENDSCGGDPEFRCRYETIKFEKGRQLMDGETALKFVRSRNAQGDEGTDLARAARQQKVMKALEEKLLSQEVFLSPQKILALIRVLQEHIETDIDPSSAAILARRLVQAREKISAFVLSDQFLINPPPSPRYDNLYVFIPKEGDWQEVHQWIKKVLP